MLVASVLTTLAIAFLGAAAYLALRDDLIGASVARQARMQQAYEDRISTLRAQVDQITSRQLLDQQMVETKVGELLQRQSELTQRHRSLSPILGPFSESTLPADVPVPAKKHDEHASLVSDNPVSALAYASADIAASPFSFLKTRKSEAEAPSTADRADTLFLAINRTLRSIEDDQMSRVASLATNAYETAEAIGDALESAGLNVTGDLGKGDVGGPFIPIDSGANFDTRVRELDDALGKLEALKKEVRRLPIANPAANWVVTSSFGSRSDPFLDSNAFHAGMDFRAQTGAPILATAAGVVTKAGWNGGYGRLVEIDHGNGFSTRYGHMSKVLVAEGDKVKIGDVIGQVGSSGRSTGPHLHYEVRKNGTAVDPLRFINAGKKVDRYLAAL